MSVTRREMITAASAIGITAAFSQPAAAQPAPTTSTFPPEADIASRDVVNDHLDRAAHIISHGDPETYGSITRERLKEDWLTVPSAPQPLPPTDYKREHFLRGVYRANDPDKTGLILVYGLSKKTDAMGVVTTYSIPFIGSPLDVFTNDDVDNCLEALRLDLAKVLSTSQSVDYTMPAYVLGHRNLGSRLLSHIMTRNIAYFTFTPSNTPSNDPIKITVKLR